MSQPEAEIVQFDNVGLRYGTDKEILTDVSFTLYPGCFYFLTGASGAGTSSNCAAHSARSMSVMSPSM